MTVDQDWHEKIFGEIVGPIPPGGITRTVHVPEEVYQFFMEYAAGRSRHVKVLQAEGYDYDALLQRCAAALQAGDMQESRIKGLVQVLTDWQSTVQVTNELTERSLALVEDARTLMELQYALGVKEGKSVAPKKGAEKRHAEHRAMKADVFSWLDINMSSFKSMDRAAEAIAGKVAPIAFRTARAWVGEWKKVRAASKA